MADRREALKIIGAIGTTCAFPFSSGELYGQHAHPAPGAQAPASAPRYFNQSDMALLNRLTDLIIPPTGSPGAAEAGVPAYIDLVVSSNSNHQQIYTEGLAWLNAEAKRSHERSFTELEESQQIALLTPLSEAVDQDRDSTPQAKFFRALKSMTADGYYTSKVGLMQELGFKGSSVLAEFPACDLPEH